MRSIGGVAIAVFCLFFCVGLCGLDSDIKAQEKKPGWMKDLWKKSLNDRSPVTSSSVLSTRHRFSLAFGTDGGFREHYLPGKFDGLVGIHIDSNGYIYTAEFNGTRVQVFDSSETPVLMFGSFGDGQGEFGGAVDISTDSAGNIYVTDLPNYRVQKFSSTGKFITAWGGFGSDPGDLGAPIGIAVGPDDLVYVCDAFNDRIQVFDTDGNYLYEWGSYGISPGEFFSPFGIEVDAAGTVYVADSGNNRIQVFDKSGVFLFEFGTTGSGPGEFFECGWVDVDSNGSIFVVDRFNARVQKFTSTGTFQIEFGDYGLSDGEFYSIEGLAVSPAGKVYVGDYARNIVQRFSSGGSFERKFGTNDGQFFWGDGDGEFDFPNDVACSPDGYVYVSDSSNDRVQKFTLEGDFVMTWGAYGTADGEFNDPEGISCDAAGNVYVVDENNDRVQKFDADGNHLLTIGSAGHGDGEFDDPQDVAIDSGGNIYVADQDNDRVQKFDSAGNYLLQWGISGSDPGEFQNPEAIAINSKDQVFVCDSSLDTIQVFDSDGSYIRTIDLDIYPVPYGTFPNSMAFNAEDNLFITFNPEYVAVLNPADNLIEYFGGYGWEYGRFITANGICVSPEGHVFVVDEEAERVQRFSPFAVGSLRVKLKPDSIKTASGWKLNGQEAWRPSGNTSHGIEVGDQQVVFAPVNGFSTPNPQLITILQGQVTQVTVWYTPSGTAANGINVIFPMVPGFEDEELGWRVRGQGDGYILGSGLASLPPGKYIVEFLPKPGWFAPPVVIEISENAGVTIRPRFFPLLPTGSNDFPADGAGDPILWNQETGVWTLADGRTWNMGGKHGWPVPGDYNGDGEMEPAAWLPKQSLWRVRGQFELENFGQTGDFPVPGDYDGDGKTDPALYRQSTGEWLISFSSTRESSVNAAEVAVQTSPVRGVPLPGDYDGDGVAEGAVYDANNFTWFIPGQPNVEFGHPGFVPVPADYDGDGITDLAIANIARGFYLIRGGKRYDVATQAGDIPSMIDYDGDGKAEFSWYRPSEGVWYFDDGTSITIGGEEDIPVTR